MSTLYPQIAFLDVANPKNIIPKPDEVDLNLGVFDTIFANNINIPVGSLVTTTGVQSITNKSFEDSTTSFYDTTVTTKLLKFDVASTTSNTTQTLRFSNTTNRITNFPDSGVALTDIVTTDGIQNINSQKNFLGGFGSNAVNEATSGSGVSINGTFVFKNNAMSAINSGQFITLVPSTSSGLQLAIPDSVITGGNPRGNKAVDLQLTRVNANQVAGGDSSALVGGFNNSVSPACIGGTIFGSSNSTVVDGQSNTICGGGNNSVGSLFNGIVGGYGGSIASGNASNYCGNLGGFTNIIISGDASNIIGGLNNNISGSVSSLLSCESCNITNRDNVIINSDNSFISGFENTVIGNDVTVTHNNCIVLSDSSSPVSTSIDEQLILNFTNGVTLNGSPLSVTSSQQYTTTVNPTTTNNIVFQTLATINLPQDTTYMITSKILGTGVGISGSFLMRVWVERIASVAIIRANFDSTKQNIGALIDMQYIVSGSNVLLQQLAVGATITWNGFIERIGTQ